MTTTTTFAPFGDDDPIFNQRDMHKMPADQWAKAFAQDPNNEHLMRSPSVTSRDGNQSLMRSHGSGIGTEGFDEHGYQLAHRYEPAVRTRWEDQFPGIGETQRDFEERQAAASAPERQAARSWAQVVCERYSL